MFWQQVETRQNALKLFCFDRLYMLQHVWTRLGLESTVFERPVSGAQGRAATRATASSWWIAAATWATTGRQSKLPASGRWGASVSATLRTRKRTPMSHARCCARGAGRRQATTRRGGPPPQGAHRQSTAVVPNDPEWWRPPRQRGRRSEGGGAGWLGGGGGAIICRLRAYPTSPPRCQTWALG